MKGDATQILSVKWKKSEITKAMNYSGIPIYISVAYIIVI